MTDMDKSEFDKFADDYYATLKAGIKVSGDDPEYFAEYKIADIARELSLLRGDPAHPVQILDFGAGIGTSVPFVAKYFETSALTCIDPSIRSLEVAEGRYPGRAKYVPFDGQAIPFGDGTFDIAYAMCVFHHIDAQQHISLLSELRRVLKPKGLLFVFEHNPYNPLTVRVVNRCPIDEKAVLISSDTMAKRLLQAGFDTTIIRYRIFFPSFLGFLRPLEPALSRVPLGGQYYAMSKK
jgi:SAM-dependent methyltransferase